MLFDITNIDIDLLNTDVFTRKQVAVDILRLDKIHPVVSGNKLFKLHYFLEETLSSPHHALLTFGGAYSNHLLATAFACNASGIRSIGIVRGERPPALSKTLEQCIDYGMQLKFISRATYNNKNDTSFLNDLQKEFGEFVSVPEGGYHPAGARGAALIMNFKEAGNYSHICTAIGTATTLAGLLQAAPLGQTITAIPVLKNFTDIDERMAYLLGSNERLKQLRVFDQYHFGGYAKRTVTLIDFMNLCWQKFQLPLDFVYTAKMLYAVFDSIEKDRFPKGSRILCIHTGGLQGNHSLPVDTLLY
jgi:1-aminocyclopropane-1-carboxylate deaminase/D-cysteine desulfhydrase-like pyridoxal-dependent ACC family enzyme